MKKSSDTLKFITISFIGFKAQDVLLSGSKQNNVVLKAETGSLDEVIVVGYGAVIQVGSEVFEDRPMPNITRGLQGVMPNLNIAMRDGKPTRGADYNVRGSTSIGAGGGALILIDGVPGDPRYVKPQCRRTRFDIKRRLFCFPGGLWRNPGYDQKCP